MSKWRADLIKQGYRLFESSPDQENKELKNRVSNFGRFKEDYRDEMNEIGDFKQLEKFIKRKIRYYNQKRLHTSLNNQNPLKFTKNYLKNISLSER